MPPRREPTFAFDDQTEALIVDVCQQLDGIPLAIELAAARTSHLSLPDIAGHLEERFRLLTGGRRRARQRHQTLQAALDWSHELLDPEGQRALRHAAVFAGGFTLDALAVVLETDPGPALLDLVGSLVHRSLIVAVTDAPGPTRYRLLETVRLYGLERPRRSRGIRGHEGPARRVGAEVARLTAPGSGMFVGDTEDRRIERENVIAALEWVADGGDLEALARLAPDVIDGLGVFIWVDDSWRYLGRADVAAAVDGEAHARYLAAGSLNTKRAR